VPIVEMTDAAGIFGRVQQWRGGVR